MPNGAGRHVASHRQPFWSNIFLYSAGFLAYSKAVRLAGGMVHSRPDAGYVPVKSVRELLRFFEEETQRHQISKNLQTGRLPGGSCVRPSRTRPLQSRCHRPCNSEIGVPTNLSGQSATAFQQAPHSSVRGVGSKSRPVRDIEAGRVSRPFSGSSLPLLSCPDSSSCSSPCTSPRVAADLEWLPVKMVQSPGSEHLPVHVPPRSRSQSPAGNSRSLSASPSRRAALRSAPYLSRAHTVQDMGGAGGLPIKNSGAVTPRVPVASQLGSGRRSPAAASRSSSALSHRGSPRTALVRSHTLVLSSSPRSSSRSRPMDCPLGSAKPDSCVAKDKRHPSSPTDAARGAFVSPTTGKRLHKVGSTTSTAQGMQEAEQIRKISNNRQVQSAATMLCAGAGCHGREREAPVDSGDRSTSKSESYHGNDSMSGADGAAGQIHERCRTPKRQVVIWTPRCKSETVEF